jgi:hypothetical protein
MDARHLGESHPSCACQNCGGSGSGMVVVGQTGLDHGCLVDRPSIVLEVGLSPPKKRILRTTSGVEAAEKSEEHLVSVESIVSATKRSDNLVNEKEALT